MKLSDYLRGPVPKKDRVIDLITWFALGFLFVLLISKLSGQTTATLSVTADGTQPFTYSWQKDGAVITGANNASYVISPLTPATSGLYVATVLNAAGSAVAPANLVVLSSSTPAPDLSKQYLVAANVGPYSPPVAQFPQFAIVPLKKVNDPGSHWNDATSVYTVGAGEGGVYEVRITLRSQDQPPFDDSIGITYGTTNTDVDTLWVVTPPKPTDPASYIRWGAEHADTLTFNAGDQIRVNMFVQAAISLQSVKVMIRRLY